MPQNMSHVEHTSYISCALEHVSCWTPCIHQLCLRTCLMLNTVYIRCASEHVSCWIPCIHQVRLTTCLMLTSFIRKLCLRTCLMLNTLYTSAVPQNMYHVEHPVYTSCASQHVYVEQTVTYKLVCTNTPYSVLLGCDVSRMCSLHGVHLA